MPKGRRQRQRPVAQGPARRSQRATTRAATAATESTTQTETPARSSTTQTAAPARRSTTQTVAPARRSTTQTSTATTDPERFVTEEVFQSSLERLLQQIREEVRAEMVATPQLPGPVTSATQALLHSLPSRQQGQGMPV